MTRGMGGQSPSNIAQFLKGISFPARKKDLVKHAQKNNADKNVLDVLNKMPDQEYGNMADIMKGYGSQEH